MRTRAILAALLALSGCDQPRKGADGYAFGEPEFTRSAVQVEFVMHDSMTSLRRQLPPGHVERGREAMAWGIVHLNEPRCQVHIIDPARTYAPEWIGHELMHCIYGRWHD